MLERCHYGIVNHCDYPVHTGKLEGVNNKIKVIKRKAYGFQDLRYFTLKIYQAFSNQSGEDRKFLNVVVLKSSSYILTKGLDNHCHLKTKTAHHLFTWQSGLVFTLLTQEVTPSVTPIFCNVLLFAGF